MNQLNLFDYQELDAETRIVVQQRTSEIKALMKRTAGDIVEIGEKLTDVRNRLVGNGNGGFEGWLRLEFDWGKTTAYRFINVAESFSRSNLERLDFAPSALYLLSSPSTPDDARREAIERAEAGERITHSTARVIIEEHKPAPPVLEHSVPVSTLEFQHQELLRPVEELEDDTPAWLREDDDPVMQPDLAVGLDRLAADLAAYTPAVVGETEMMVPMEAESKIEQTDATTELHAGVAAPALAPEPAALPAPPTPAPLPPPPVVRAAPWVASISVPEGDAPALVTVLHGNAPRSLLPESVARRMIAAIEARIEPAATIEIPESVPMMAPDWLIPR